MSSTEIGEAFKAAWVRLSRRAQRIFLVSVACPVLILATATAAYADGVSAPSSLSWMKIKDSHGISVWKYELSLDQGGVTNPNKMLWSSLTTLIWEAYRAYVAIAIWLIDWVLSFDWLATVSKPMMSMGDNLTVIVDAFGLVPTLLTITAIAAVLWMARGRWVLGIFELFLSLIIASLAVGALSNPVGLVAGQNGMLLQSRDFGLAISSGLVNDGDTTGSADDMRADVSATMADTFLRQPTQMINFGIVIDGTGCEKEWDDVIKAGTYGEDDDIRSAMGDCAGPLKMVADNPNSAMTMSAGVLFPAAFIVLVFAMLLAGAVLLASVQALYRGLKLILDLVLGLLPGSARGGLWMSIADLVMALVTVVFSVVFLTAYLLLIQAVFASGGAARMQTFFAVDILLVVGIILYWRGRGRIKAAAEKLAQALSSRPGGGGASSLPARNKFNPTEIYYKGKLAAAGGAAVARGAGGVATGTGRALNTAGSAVGKTGAAAGKVASRVRRNGATFSADQASGASNTSPPAAQRVQLRLNQPKPSRRGQLARLGGTAAMAYATGGTSLVKSAVVRTAGQQATAAIGRRAALNQCLRPAALPSPAAGASSQNRRSPTHPPLALGARLGTSPATGATPPRDKSNLTPATTTPTSVPPPSASGRGEITATAGDSLRRPPQPLTAPPAPPVVSVSLHRLSPDQAAAAQRLQARLAERRNRAIALPPPKRPGN